MMRAKRFYLLSMTLTSSARQIWNYSRISFTIIITASNLGCRNAHIKEIFPIDDNKFKFADVKKFSLQNRDIDKFKLQLLDSLDEIKYLSNVSTIWNEVNNLPGYFTQPAFYSVQHYKNFYAYVFLTSNETCCTYLNWINYDKEGNPIDYHPVAYSGGDGEWAIDGYGEFINNTTYLLIEIETIGSNMDARDTVINGWSKSYYIVKSDSSNQKIIFNKDGSIIKGDKQNYHSEHVVIE